MTERRLTFALLACVACCAAPLAVLLAGGSLAALAWILWPAAGIVIALGAAATAGWVRHRRAG